MFAICNPNQGELSAWQPMLLCQVCRGPLVLYSAWSAFPATGDPKEPRGGVWGHKLCLDRRGAALLNTRRILLWRGVDLLTRLAERAESDRETRAVKAQRTKRGGL